MKYRIHHIVFILFLCGFYLVISFTRASAQGEKIGTILTIDAPTSTTVGQAPVIGMTLTSQDHTPLPFEPYSVYLNNDWLKDSHTDNAGKGIINLGRRLDAGDYEVRVIFDARQNYDRSEDIATITIDPAILTLKTAPAIEDVRFRLGDQIYPTDKDGIVTIPIKKIGTYRLEALPWDEVLHPSTRVAFSLWNDNIFEPSRDIIITSARTLNAGFQISHLVRYDFIDTTGQSVPVERVTSLSLKSSYGMRYQFDGHQPEWLEANRVLKRRGKLVSTDLRYVLENVTVDGSNVINEGQQRFSVRENDVWDIHTLLYFAHFKATDAVFGSSLGSGISLQYPDAHEAKLAFESNGEVKVGPLARGLYYVKVVGASGMAALTSVAVSRNQDVELKIFSTRDIGTVLGLCLAFALGFLILGRPQLLRVPHKGFAISGRIMSAMLRFPSLSLAFIRRKFLSPQ